MNEYSEEGMYLTSPKEKNNNNNNNIFLIEYDIFRL